MNKWISQVPREKLSHKKATCTAHDWKAKSHVSLEDFASVSRVRPSREILAKHSCRTMSYAIPPQNQLIMRKTLKSFMAFDITPHGLIFRVVVGSQIVVPSTIPLSQWHSRDLNPWPWLWYHLSDHELSHSTSKLIGDKEDTLKSFMAFDTTPRGPVFKVVVGSQIVAPPTICLAKCHVLFYQVFTHIIYILITHKL